MKKTIGILMLSLGFISISSASSPQKGLPMGDRVQILCEEIYRENPLCQEYVLTTGKKLELKGEIFTEIEKYCQKNYTKALCGAKTPNALGLYCSKYNQTSTKCQEWRAWKRKELELKGKLIETLNAFCRNHPKHRICLP